MLQALGNMLSRKSRSMTLEQAASVFEWMRFKNSAGISVSRNDAVRVSALFCAIRVIAEGVAQAPVRLLQEDFDAQAQRYMRVQRPDLPIHRLLARRPNSWQTPFQFIEYMVTAAVLDGGFLGVKVRDANGEVREIIPVVMGGWGVEQTPDYELIYRVADGNKVIGTYQQSDVVHFAGPSLDTIEGVNPIDVAREALGLSMAIERQQARMAGRGGLPSGILAFEQGKTPEQISQLKAAWSAKYGVGGEGGVAVLDSAAKFYPMTMTSVDAQHLETRRFQIEEVARLMRVQPIMLMQADKAATFASAEQMFRNHVIHTLAPWMTRLEHTLNRDLLTRSSEQNLRFDMDERALLRGDFADQAEYYAKALGAGGQPAWMTQNEVRIERDMNPVDDARANQLPMGAMGQAIEGQTDA